MHREAVDALYLAHAVLELALGLVKLRGHYEHERGPKPVRTKAYVRHHGVSLLSLSLLGSLAWWHGLAHDAKAGFVMSICFGVFHGGAVASNGAACLVGAVPLRKVVLPHGPLAALFFWHAASS